jgi:hypothetical protein
VKRQWTLDELLRNFTLQPAEVELIPDTSDSGRLGFAALLKYFQHEGHFPHRRHDIPEDVIVYLASQLDVLPEAYNQYRWEGRTITRHRVQIREWLGFRPYTESDGPELGMGSRMKSFQRPTTQACLSQQPMPICTTGR